MRSRLTIKPLHFFALAMLLLCAYSNAIYTPFQFDDYNVIVAAQSVHSWGAWWADLAHGLRPLLKLSYMLNWVNDTDVLGFHVCNLLLHLANSLLVYVLVVRVCSLTGQENIASTAGMLTATLFALHPAHTEAVTYISGRSASLMTLFYLAALLAYAQGREHRQGWYLYLISPVLFVLAVASKETAVTLPFALLLWERCFYPYTMWREVCKRLAAHGVVLLLVAILLLMQERYWKMMAFSVNLHSVSENLYTQIHAMTYLLGQLLLPVRMNIDPDLPVRTSLSSVWPETLLWLALAGVAWFVCRHWRGKRAPLFFFALFWLMLQLLPLYVFLPRLDVANDRQLYLADWPVLMLISLAIFSWVTRAGLRDSLIVVLLIAIAAASYFRNQDYRSEVALWEVTARDSPRKARPQNNLGYAYFLSGRVAEAELAYQAALKNDINFWRAENNLLQLRENRQ